MDWQAAGDWQGGGHGGAWEATAPCAALAAVLERAGWHQWTTPTGRTYTQEPWRYTA